MRMWVLEGDDDGAIAARRAALLEGEGAGGDREDIDVAVDEGGALVYAIASPSLFSGARTVMVDNIDALSADNLTRIIEAADGSDAVVIARNDGALSAAFRKKLAPVATIEAFKVPKGREVGDRVAALAAEHNVTLTGPVRKLLVERCGHDLNRVRSICVQLDLVGITKPDERQILTLLGSSGAPGVPWAVTDALDKGDAAAAIEAASQVEPMIVLAWLGSQLDAAGQIRDSGAKSPDEAAAVLGKSRFAAERPYRLASRLGSDGLGQAWQILFDAQVQARSKVGAATATELGLARLAPLWGARRSR